MEWFARAEVTGFPPEMLHCCPRGVIQAVCAGTMAASHIQHYQCHELHQAGWPT